jgi:hypothetical protein
VDRAKHMGSFVFRALLPCLAMACQLADRV